MYKEYQNDNVTKFIKQTFTASYSDRIFISKSFSLSHLYSTAVQGLNQSTISSLHFLYFSLSTISSLHFLYFATSCIQSNYKKQSFNCLDAVRTFDSECCRIGAPSLPGAALPLNRLEISLRRNFKWFGLMMIIVNDRIVYYMRNIDLYQFTLSFPVLLFLLQ